ncbi:hypothetical protein [Nodosilinea sp. E11]|uniref:hypothetical protein n=1 Tax=Nodosilinea sp. E11 TaxID=3037479 RepID=UPI0029344D85|nr:hypothetical protein [Nodosilinea sp. E11]WOD39634.1 hypothetical protein RRF56_25850 [Nodosilinea sp. E11]
MSRGPPNFCALGLAHWPDRRWVAFGRGLLTPATTGLGWLTLKFAQDPIGNLFLTVMELLAIAP